MDEFLSSSISSKYYTPSQFQSNKFSKNHFSMTHINIASLPKHVDELRCLLSLLDHAWDIVAISETRLHSVDPITNLDIDGYDFIHTLPFHNVVGLRYTEKMDTIMKKLNPFLCLKWTFQSQFFLKLKINPKRTY